MEKIISDGNKKLCALIDNPKIYTEGSYKKAKQMFNSEGYDFPENFYQTHRFLASVSELCGVPFYLIAMNDSTEGGITGPLICLDKIQELMSEKTISCISNGVLLNIFSEMCNSTVNNLISGKGFSISDYELCSSIQEILDSTFDINEPGSEIVRFLENDSMSLHFKKSVLISEGTTYNIHDAYLFNFKENKFTGIYHDEYGDISIFYRSIVDYFLKGFSGFSDAMHDAYISYIQLNEVSIDDGIPYKEIEDECIVVDRNVGCLALSDEYVGTYNMDCYGDYWDAELNGYPMRKGW